jgi:DNA-binding transcriptional MerR regulator
MKKRLKMKDLERATGVGREAIRFYIREGLLPEPERPGRNVAWYDDSFVERISLIKHLQQERFLPLSVIKGIVGSASAPSPAEVQALRQLDGKLGVQEGKAALRPAEKLSALARRVNLPAAEIRELAAVGAVEIAVRGGAQWLEGRSVAIIEEWAAIRQAGFSDDLGFGVHDAKLYVELVQWLARQELRIFTKGVTDKVDPARARAMARHGIDGLNRILALLREATLLRYIAAGNLPDDVADPRDDKAVGE